MAPFRRLSERRGLVEPEDVLYEGIPGHAEYPLREWLTERVNALQGQDAAALAVLLRIEVSSNQNPASALIGAALADDDDYLEILDALLQVKGDLLPVGSRFTNGQRLRNILHLAGSAWTVSDDDKSLERRVDAETKAAVEIAVRPAEEVSKELKVAWANAYGRNPDPSDAWDHAIKAVEELLAPIIIPSDPKATLGAILSAIAAKPSKWTYGMDDGGTKDEMMTLHAMLGLMWPNPDRHGGNQKRTPRQDEAERVVQLAVTIVNLCRGHLVVL